MSRFASYWPLDPQIDFLNHGSFGACPRAVLEHQARLRLELEEEPVDFLVRRLPDLFDRARERLAAFVGANPDNLAAVTNATAGVNTVLRSLDIRPGDELLVTDHAYNACRNALDYVAERSGARVVVASVPFPVPSLDEVIEPILSASGDRTRLALLDHVTSATGLVLPVEQLIAPLQAGGVEVLIDGAHAPGMLPLELDRWGCDYYAGNCHKWLCAPKGAGFLYVRRERQQHIRPLSISHGANSPRPGRSRFHDELDWTGTQDPTPFLCVPTAIDHLASLVAGGWPEIRRRNRELALEARSLLTDALEIAPPSPDEMIGSLVSVPLPGTFAAGSPRADPLGEKLFSEHRIEVLASRWPALGLRLLRISAQLYNRVEQYQRLAELLPRALVALTPEA